MYQTHHLFVAGGVDVINYWVVGYVEEVNLCVDNSKVPLDKNAIQIIMRPLIISLMFKFFG